MYFSYKGGQSVEFKGTIEEFNALTNSSNLLSLLNQPQSVVVQHSSASEADVPNDELPYDPYIEPHDHRELADFEFCTPEQWNPN